MGVEMSTPAAFASTVSGAALPGSMGTVGSAASRASRRSRRAADRWGGATLLRFGRGAGEAPLVSLKYRDFCRFPPRILGDDYTEGPVGCKLAAALAAAAPRAGIFGVIEPSIGDPGADQKTSRLDIP